MEDGTPRIIIHDLDHVRAALTAARASGTAVTLLSPPRAASYLGPDFFAALMARAANEFPDVTFRAVLDCGAAAGRALQALRQGTACIRLDGVAEDAATRIADIAAQSGAEIDRSDAPALDLLDIAEPEKAALEWLTGRAG